MVTQIPSIQFVGMWLKLWNWCWQNEPQFDGIDTHLGGRDVNEWFYAWLREIAEWLTSTLKRRN